MWFNDMQSYLKALFMLIGIIAIMLVFSKDLRKEFFGRFKNL